MKEKPSYPPGLFLRFFRWFCHPDLVDHIEGDLMELYGERIRRRGKRNADLRFMTDVILLFRPAIIKSFHGSELINSTDMFKNYFKVGIRNHLKYKAFSFINVFGLAIAMSVCMLIILMIADQKKYDSFQENSDRIYRVLTRPADATSLYASGPFPLANTLKIDYPFIRESVCLYRAVGGDLSYNQHFAEVRGYFTDDAFFNIFSFELSEGNPKNALSQPNSLVITRKIAHELFGNVDPLGKTVDINDRGLDLFTSEGNEPVGWGSFTITGVLADKVYRSHLEFDALVSASTLYHLYREEKMTDLTDNWSNYYRCYTYVLLKDHADPEKLTGALDQISQDKYRDNEKMEGSRFIPQSLAAITPGPALGNAPTVRLPLFAFYILSVLALVILGSACLNYINLSVARAVTRSREIGLRKVNGARRKDLVIQFLSESMITVFLALLLAIILLYFIKTAFMGLWLNRYLHFKLETDFRIYLVFAGFALITGLVAGLFPAFRLTRYKPVISMKNLEGMAVSRSGIRKGLTVGQFIVSLVFIITSIVIYQQFRFFMQYEYGFNANNVMNINLQSNEYQLVKSAFEKVPGVTRVAGCAYFPATGRNDNTSLTIPGTDEKVTPIDLRADENFIHVLGIPLVAGKNLPADGAGDRSSILINETAVKALGYDKPAEIIGEAFTEYENHPVKVTGVVRDFTFFLLFSGRRTGPIVIRNDPSGFNYITLRISAAGHRELIRRLEDAWKTVDPVHPFKYEFYDDRIAGNNQPILDIVSIIGFFAFMAITIACLGLLGMAMYTTERRTREIGIRKVLGAHEFSAAILLSREFLALLGIAIAVAAPVSYFLNNFWLNFLVAHAAFGLGTVLAGSLLLLTLGLFTIVPQAIRVSGRNPVDSLRTE